MKKENDLPETSWWLDVSALPNHHLWARLTVLSDGSAEVFDLDGNYHRFRDKQEAVFFLSEDEYCSLAMLKSEGEVALNVVPPTAISDQQLLRLMQQEFKHNQTTADK